MLKRVASNPSKGDDDDDGGGGDDDDDGGGDGVPRRIFPGVQAQVPLRPGME